MVVGALARKFMLGSDWHEMIFIVDSCVGVWVGFGMLRDGDGGLP